MHRPRPNQDISKLIILVMDMIDITEELSPIWYMDSLVCLLLCAQL